MIVKFNSLNRYETPMFTLCNPGCVFNDGLLSNVVGNIIDHEAEEIVFNFNSTSELSLRVDLLHHDNEEEDRYAQVMFKSLQNRRLIFASGIGFFVITDISDNDDNGVRYKDITAKSVDEEISHKAIPYIADGTYRFSTNQADKSQKGIFETIIEVLPLWTIGFVDMCVSERWRTFEDVDVTLNCLGFLIEQIQQAYECIVLFDIINRTISVYDQANYIRKTNILITKDDVINSLSISENADDLYTAITVEGSEDVLISAVNPLGTNTMYNFEYYVDWMSPELSNKVKIWQKNIEDLEETYYNLNLEYYQMLKQASNYKFDIDRLSTQITMYTRCRDNIVAEASTDYVKQYNKAITEAGGTAITVYPEITETIREIDRLTNEKIRERKNIDNLLNTLNRDISNKKSTIDGIRNMVSIEYVFTESEYEELSHYIYEGNYSDEYVVITDGMDYEAQFEQMKILYDRTKSQLKKISSPSQEFTIDTESFLFSKEFIHLSEELETGCLIDVELDTNDVASLFLSTMSINYEDHNISLVYGNRFNKFDPKSLFDKVLGNISKSANSINYIKDTLYPIKNGEYNLMKEAIQTSRDITMNAALTSTDEQVVIDGSGYTGKKLMSNGNYDPRQIKITGRSIVFTDDAWETSKIAIGELFLDNSTSVYGVNAEVLIGDLILGNSLRIVDNNGNDLMTVIQDEISTQVQGLDGSLSIMQQTTNGILTRVESLEHDFTSIEETANAITLRIGNLERKPDQDSITTSTGYTFNADGLRITKSGEEMENKLDNTGMYVSRSGEAILTANNQGVTALNLTSEKYLTIGKNSRFEDFSTETDVYRTACYFIGGIN